MYYGMIAHIGTVSSYYYIISQSSTFSKTTVLRSGGEAWFGCVNIDLEHILV